MNAEYILIAIDIFLISLTLYFALIMKKICVVFLFGQYYNETKKVINGAIMALQICVRPLRLNYTYN